MNGNLERIIDICLLDGKISTDEERLILERAKELGENTEEIKIIIQEKLSLKQRTQFKYGDVFKCSGCGEFLYQYDSYCKSCGTSFKNEIQSTLINKIKRKIVYSDNLVETIKKLPTPKDLNSLIEILMFFKSLVKENPNSFEEVFINDVLYYKSKEIILKISFSNKDDLNHDLKKRISEISENLKETFKTSFYFEEIYLKKRKQFSRLSQTILLISLLFTWLPYFTFNTASIGALSLLISSFLLLLIIKPIHNLRVKSLKNKVELLEEY